MFNEDWMRDRGFIDKHKPALAMDVIKKHENLKLLTIAGEQKVSDAYGLMKKYNISQLPVKDGNEFIGSINDSDILEIIMQNHQNKEMHIKEIMKPPFPFVHHSTPISDLSLLIDKNNQAVLMNDMSGNTHIITKFDIIDSISHD
jgi:cystathionine beta-synthase